MFTPENGFSSNLILYLSMATMVIGVLGAVAHSPEQLEIDLKWIEDEIGDRPYGVDLIVPAKYAGDEGGGYTLDDIRALIPDTHREFVDDIPVLIGLHNQYKSKGFEIVGVSLDTQAAAVLPFIKQNKMTWANIFQPGVFDSPLAQQYGILTAPTMFLIGPDGKVLSSGISLSELKDALRKRLD